MFLHGMNDRRGLLFDKSDETIGHFVALRCVEEKSEENGSTGEFEKRKQLFWSMSFETRVCAVLDDLLTQEDNEISFT